MDIHRTVPARRACAGVVVLLLVLVGPAASAHAQTGPEEACDAIGLPWEVWDTLVRHHLSRMVGLEGGPTVGTFAAVDVGAAKASLGAATVVPSGAILGLEVSGGAAGGILPVLSSGRLNRSLGARLQYHSLSRDTLAVRYRDASCVAYRRAERRILERFEMDSIAVALGVPEARRRLELDRLDGRLRELRAAIAQLDVDDPLEAAVADTLRLTLERTRRDSTSVARPVPSRNQQIHALQTRRGAALGTLIDSVQVTGFSMGWWTFEYGVDHAAFELLDPSAAPGGRVTEHTYLTQTVGLKYQWFHLTHEHGATRYLSLGFQAGRADNRMGLASVELAERTPLPDESVETFTERRRTVLTGAYLDDLEFLRIEADLYQFVLTDNRGAVHVAPAVEWKDGADGMKGVFDVGLGYLVSATDETSHKSRVNAELLWQMRDLGNIRDSDEGFFERSTLALRVSFPFNLSLGGD